MFLGRAGKGKNKEKMILCDFQDDDSGTERCKSKATRFLLQCIHPPSPNYKQQGGEYGSYLGPEPSPNNFTYRPNDMTSENTRLAMYFYCHPTYEDEYHIRLNYCEKHWDKPTYIKCDWQIMYNEAKEEMKLIK